MHHQYGISVVVSQTSFRGGTVGDIVECCLFFQSMRHFTFEYENMVLNLFVSHQEPIKWSEQLPTLSLCNGTYTLRTIIFSFVLS